MTGSEIRELRISRHLTQEGLARLVGVSEETVSRWENDRKHASPLAVRALHALFHPNETISVGTTVKE